MNNSLLNVKACSINARWSLTKIEVNRPFAGLIFRPAVLANQNDNITRSSDKVHLCEATSLLSKHKNIINIFAVVYMFRE